MAMYKDRLLGGSKVEVGFVDRKRVEEAVDKHLEEPSTSAGKQLEHGDQRHSSLSENRKSEGNICPLLRICLVVTFIICRNAVNL